MSFISGLKKFLFESNFIDLAVAIVIGIALGELVSAFIADWVTPLLAAIGGEPDFSALFFELNNSKFLYGHFINALLTFVVLAFVIYAALVYPMTLYKMKQKSSLKMCEMCREDIHIESRVCKFCRCECQEVEINVN
jgi:large conductance mechanosensitive channel